MEPENLPCMAPGCSLIRVSKCHCEMHAGIYKKRYLEYKSLQQKLVDVSASDDVPQLLKCLNQYAKVMKLRQICLRKYFKPEFWDEGHRQMICNLWKNFVIIEKRISQLVSQKSPEQTVPDDIEENDEEQTVIETPEQAIVAVKKFSAMELLSHPESCLSKQWTLNVTEREKVDKTLINLMIMKPMNSDKYQKINLVIQRREEGYKVVWAILQLLGDKNVSPGRRAKRKVDFNLRLSACCLKVILRCLLIDNLRYILISQFIDFLIEPDQDSGVWWASLNDQRCLPDMMIADENLLFTPLAKVKKDYILIIKQTKVKKIEENWETEKSKIEKLSQLTGKTTYQISRRIIGTRGVIVHHNSFRNWTYHDHGLKECQKCLREITEEVSFGTYH